MVCCVDGTGSHIEYLATDQFTKYLFELTLTYSSAPGRFAAEGNGHGVRRLSICLSLPRSQEFSFAGPDPCGAATACSIFRVSLSQLQWSWWEWTQGPQMLHGEREPGLFRGPVGEVPMQQTDSVQAVTLVVRRSKASTPCRDPLA